MVEEAHRLLRRAGSADGPGGGGAAGHAVEMFAGLLAEIRAYGEGLIIAEQIPARLVPDVIKNTAVKIVHRLPAADDREAVGATMNASPSQSRYLVTLPPGQAAVFSDGMDFPILVRVADGSPREAGPPVPAGDARAVVHPRSATCGAECQARPCTLRDMRAAQRALEGAGPMRPWAELAVLAHLTGWPTPVPQPAALGTITALPARVRQCALSHAVDAAVAARAAVIADPARAGRPRLRRHHRPDGPGRVALPARRAAMAAGGRGDRGRRVRRRPAVGHRGRRAAAGPAGRVHRLPVAGAVPAAARRQDRGVTAGGVTLAGAAPAAASGDGWSGLPPQRPVTHIQISAAAVRNRTVDVIQSPSMSCTCWNQGIR